MTYDLELSHLSKVFENGTVAVDDFNLQVSKGEFIAFLGPSGCGKTTTLRMIGGFEEPTQGTVTIAGRVVNHLPPEARPTSMIFQNYALFPHMNVRRNVEYGLRVRKVPPKERRSRVNDILEKLDLTAIADSSLDGLSGGQRQRVALARGLAVEPDILLLDEPLGALNAELRKRIQTELRYLQRKLGNTFIFVTHAQSEALAMADRVVVMNRGRLEQVAEPETLYTQPCTGFVARFIGRNSILPGSLVSCDDEIATVLTAFGHLRGRLIEQDRSGGRQVNLVVPSEVMEIYPELSSRDLSLMAQYQGNVVPGVVRAETVVGYLVVYEVGVGDALTIEVESHVDKYGTAFPAGTPVCVTWLPAHGQVVSA
ncbi:MAG: ABC transporter ATP-binding protein [Thermoleophilia bacterium]|nr:ABC transporter ATP-binding protein [Thermoleophilia bacterium]